MGCRSAVRTTQLAAKGNLTTARDGMEPLRIAAAQRLHGNVGAALTAWFATPERIETLYDLTLLRGSSNEAPDAPGLPTWVPATRTLSLAAMPARGRRLEVWRLGPGGAPERLVVGGIGELSVMIPAEYVFDTGKLYQLWFVAINGDGPSPAGPSVSSPPATTVP